MKYKYKTTHPWISFTVPLNQAPYTLWLALGEACSKCEHIAGAPLIPEVRDMLHRIYLAKGLQATTAIEGNTLTEEEVRLRIEGKGKLPPSREYLGQEIDNIERAINRIGEAVLRGEGKAITPDLIRQYNQEVLRDLDLPNGVKAGEVRSYEVAAGNYHCPPAKDCPHLLERFCGWLNEFIFPRDKDNLATGILKAILAHLYFVWIHPFGDGNGRTARLLEFQILVSSGVPSPAAHLLCNHYNRTRNEYYRQLQSATESESGCLSFIEYALQGFVDGLKEQIGVIQADQRRFIWRDFVNIFFQKEHSRKSARQKALVLALSNQTNPVSRSEIPRLSAELAGLYARKTAMTLTRDLNYLAGQGLIAKESKGYRAKTELVLALLPPRKSKAN